MAIAFMGWRFWASDYIVILWVPVSYLLHNRGHCAQWEPNFQPRLFALCLEVQVDLHTKPAKRMGYTFVNAATLWPNSEAQPTLPYSKNQSGSPRCPTESGLIPNRGKWEGRLWGGSARAQHWCTLKTLDEFQAEKMARAKAHRQKTLTAHGKSETC